MEATTSNSSMAEEFKVNDFVWAKLSGYPPWPSIIMGNDPLAPPKPQNNMQWIYFFGSHNYAWIEEKHIKPFDKYKEQYKTMYKQSSLKEAVEELENIIENMVKDPDYKIDFVKYSRKERKSIGKKSTNRRKSTGGSGTTPKRAIPLKEKNNTVPRKKARLSGSTSSMVTDDNTESNATTEEIGSTTDGTATTVDMSVVSSNNNVKVADGALSEILDTSYILKSSDKIFGVWAESIYAEGIIKNLINSGHQLHIWARSSALAEELKEYAKKQQAHLEVFNTPREVVKTSNYIFSCQSDPNEPKKTILLLGENDIFVDKGYIEMTSLDPERSKDIAELIRERGGTYLEAMIQGNRHAANEGDLLILSAGPRELFKECQSCFKAMAKASVLLGNVGAATKIHMFLQVLRGIFLSGLVECYAIADRAEVSMENFCKIFNLTEISSAYLREKLDIISKNRFSDTEEPLQQMQNDVALCVGMSNGYNQPMILGSNANEILKQARRMGYENQDSASIYNRSRY